MPFKELPPERVAELTPEQRALYDEMLLRRQPQYAANATEQKCDVPMCETVEKPTVMFDNHNITCLKCRKFTCTRCTAQIWKGEWNGEQFYKPKITIPGMGEHQVFMCPFCRATFDRFLD